MAESAHRVDTAGLRHERFSVNLAASYVDRMRSVAGQGPMSGSALASYGTRWRFSDSLGVYVKVDNLFSEVNEVARRPAGLRPELERVAYVGLSYRL